MKRVSVIIIIIFCLQVKDLHPKITAFANNVKYLYPKIMACAMFLMDIVYRLVAEIIGFFPPSKSAAIANTVVYSIIGGGVITFYLAVSCTVSKEKNSLWFVTFLLQVFLLVMYYFGKNAGGIARHYWTYLGCTEDCQRAVHFSALFCQVLAILVLTSVIPELHDAFKKKKQKEKDQKEKEEEEKDQKEKEEEEKDQKEKELKKEQELKEKKHSVFFQIIWIFVASNAMYSVLSIIPAATVCTAYAVALSCVCLAIITIVGWILTCIALDDSDVQNIGEYCCCIPLLIFFLPLPLYLFSDNQLPLEYISCPGRNITNEYIQFSGEGGSIVDHVVRLVGTFLTLILVSALARFHITL